MELIRSFPAHATLPLAQRTGRLMVSLVLQATYPLDTMRLRLAVDPSVRSVSGTMRALAREGSYGAFFRGLNASMIGVIFI